ncbi:MAG TPA: hypothetical protein VK774_09685 [Solirubrobacteraceae bacterium]|jgi:hypothetical protein|nr:hypothetical protein [Solirubrobacteraceae bacterium]
MRKVASYTLSLLAVSAACLLISAPALAALPEFSVPSGVEFPVLGEGTSRKDPHSVKLESQIPVPIYAEQLKASFEVAKSGPSGTLKLQFTNAKQLSNTCHSLGNPEGRITLQGELRLVPTNAEGSQIGALISFAENTIMCFKEGKEESSMKIKAPSIATVVATVLSKGEAVTSFGLAAKCSGAGKQEISTYFNDEEKAVEKQLLELGGLTGCMELKEEMAIILSKRVLMPATVVNKALPYIHVLPSTEKYPISLEGSTKTEVKVESLGKFGFTAAELKYTLEAAKPGASGPITLRLTGVKEKAFLAACKTEGVGTEEVLWNGEYRLVFTSLSPLAVGLLISYPELVAKCATNFEIKSPLLIGISPFGEKVKSAKIFAKCKPAGVQELTSYYNDAKELLTDNLLIWRRNESPLEDTCFSTGAEVNAGGTKEFLIEG